jgi:flagellar basal body-associated protein FliL
MQRVIAVLACIVIPAIIAARVTVVSTPAMISWFSFGLTSGNCTACSTGGVPGVVQYSEDGNYTAINLASQQAGACNIRNNVTIELYANSRSIVSDDITKVQGSMFLDGSLKGERCWLEFPKYPGQYQFELASHACPDTGEPRCKMDGLELITAVVSARPIVAKKNTDQQNKTTIRVLILVGVIVGSVGLVVVLVGLTIFHYRKKSQENKEKEQVEGRTWY